MDLGRSGYVDSATAIKIQIDSARLEYATKGVDSPQPLEPRVLAGRQRRMLQA